MKKLRISLISLLAVISVFMFSALLLVVGKTDAATVNFSVDTFINENFTLDNAVVESAILPESMGTSEISGTFGNVERATLRGLRIKPQGAVSKASVTYNKPIDISNFNGSQKLLEFISSPLEIGTAVGQVEYKYIRIKLVDLYDENVYVTLRGTPHMDNYRLTCYHSGSNTQREYGYTGSYFTSGYGTPTKHSMLGAVSGTLYSQSVYYDYSTHGFYLSNRNNSYTGAVRELGNSEHLVESGESIFTGFTTGEVKVVIELDNIRNNLTEGITVFSINGLSFAETTVKDSVAPEIIIDEKIDLANLPKGQVYSSYKIFDAYAVDNYDGIISSSDISVQVKKYNGDEYAITDGAFTPNGLGNYDIIYTATDASGNVATKTCTIDVQNSLPELTASYDTTFVTKGYLMGDIFVAPTVTATGGAGYYDVIYTVSKSGKATILTDRTFQFVSFGTHSFVTKVVDYVGNEVSIKSTSLTVTRSTAPYIVQEPIPAYTVVNQKLYIPEIEAYDFITTSNTKTPITDGTVTVQLNDGDPITLTTDSYYTPTSTGTLTIVYSASNVGNGTVGTKTYTVNVVSPATASAYFNATSGSVTTSAATSQTTYSATADTTLAFANKLSADDLSVKFYVDSTSDFTTLKFELQDVLDATQKVTLEFSKVDSSTTQLIVNGTTKKEFACQMFTNNAVVELKLEDMALYYGSTKLLDIIDTVSGTPLASFASRYVYLNISMVGVTSNGKLVVQKINNQVIGNSTSANVGPQITSGYSVKSSTLTNTPVMIPAIKVSDVLSSVQNVTAVITAPSGEKINLSNFVDGTIFIPSEVGKYTLTYTATDDAGKTTTLTKTFDIGITADIEYVSPYVPAGLKKGTSWTFEKPTLPSGTTLRIQILDTNCVLHDITSSRSYTFSTAGIYYVKYIVNTSGSLDYQTEDFRIEVR